MKPLESLCLDNENENPPSIFECRKNEFNNFREKLIILKDIKINDKLGRSDNGIIYIDKHQWGQYFRRVWYNQSREKTEKFLNGEFIEFIQFLDRYLAFLDERVQYIVKVIEKGYHTLTSEICDFINDIIPGLYNLKKTYPDCKKLKCRIDSIIMTLVDFKDKVNANMALIVAPVTIPILTQKRTFSF